MNVIHTLWLVVLSALAAPVLQEIDPTTGLSAPAVAEPVPLPQAEGAAVQVLWDLTHGVTFDYQPTGAYSQLVAILAGEGFQVSETSAGLENVDLTPYSIVVVGTGSAWVSAYTSGEVATLQQFVLGGGGLLAMGDNPSTPNTIGPVARGFGSATNLFLASPDDLFFSDFIDHPIFDGIGEIYFRAAGGTGAFRATIPAAFTDLGEAVISVVQNRPVVILGDINGLDNAYINNADNIEFARNLFHFLAGS